MIDTLWGIHKEQVIKDCFNSEFPGTLKWEKDNPIWDCNVYNKLSPKQGWKDITIMEKAVDNLYKMVEKSIETDPSFVNRIYIAFEQAYQQGNYKRLLTEVLNRFTIAKIAPKVTALMPCVFENILVESNVDISNGVYCPMSGFGGIIKGVQNYYKKHNINADIEAYDINKRFCDYYGWEQRDVLSQKITTDKVVVACPPFGTKTERWDGTPKEMYYEFHTWCNLIKEYIKAPNYILIGPEITDKTKSKYKSGVKTSGLFIKKLGVAWYPEYTK